MLPFLFKSKHVSTLSHYIIIYTYISCSEKLSVLIDKIESGKESSVMLSASSCEQDIVGDIYWALFEGGLSFSMLYGGGTSGADLTGAVSLLK